MGKVKKSTKRFAQKGYLSSAITARKKNQLKTKLNQARANKLELKQEACVLAALSIAILLSSLMSRSRLRHGSTLRNFRPNVWRLPEFPLLASLWLASACPLPVLPPRSYYIVES